MKVLLYLVFFVACETYAQQEINLVRDTIIHESKFYDLDYKRHHTHAMGGEAWVTAKSKQLQHAFISDNPGGSLRVVGSWAIQNDSLIFYIASKPFKKYHRYKDREALYPVSVTWELVTNEMISDKNGTNRRPLIFKNRLVVLTKTEDPLRVINELEMLLKFNLEKWKKESNPDDAWYVFNLNDRIKNEFQDLLFDLNLFSAFVSTR